MINVSRGLKGYILTSYCGTFKLCVNVNGTSWLKWLKFTLKNVPSFKFEIPANYCLL
jgi:hypothetical protein